MQQIALQANAFFFFQTTAEPIFFPQSLEIFNWAACYKLIKEIVK